MLTAIVRPAAALMARLRYAQKFLLIAVVMLAPLAYVSWQYRSNQRAQIAFSAKERLGVDYVRPAADLLIALAGARDAAVRAAAGDTTAAAALDTRRGEVSRALDAVAGVERRLGAELRTTAAWTALRSAVQPALDDDAGPASARAALRRWSGLTSQAAALIVAAGDGSNLILDPDLDSYYVMNALVVTVPTLLASAGHAAALGTIGAGEDDRIALALDQGAVRSTLASTLTGFETAFGSSADDALASAVSAPLDAAEQALGATMTDLDRAVRGRSPQPGAAARAATALAALATLQRALPSALDQLLVTRVDGFRGDERRVLLVALAGVLLAAYLFLGFYANVRRAVRHALGSLRSLREQDVAALGGGLDAVRSGDLTVAVELTTPPLRRDSRDELGDIAEELEAIRGRTADSVAGYEAMRAQLRAALGDHSSLEALVAAMRQLERTDLTALEDALAAMSRGDLTVAAQASTPPLRRDGELAAIFDAMLSKAQRSIAGYEQTRGRMLEMLHEISGSSERVAGAAQQMASGSEHTGRSLGEIASAVTDVADGAGEQVAAVAGARGAAEQMAAASGRGAAGARETAAEARAAAELAQEGAEVTQQAGDAMSQVRAASGEARAAIHELGERSRAIGGIVDAITAIAEKTNLLALNAAIEAARAGDAGRGFAVVADEVRMLAEQSQQAAASIGAIVGELQSGTAHAVERIEVGAERTEEGVRTVEQSRETFDRLSAAVAQMTSRVGGVAGETDGIAALSVQVQERMGAVAAVAERASAATGQVALSTQQTTAAAQEIGASAHELAQTADELRELVGRFRLE